MTWIKFINDTFTIYKGSGSNSYIEYIIWIHIGIGDIGYIVDTLDPRALTGYWNVEFSRDSAYLKYGSKYP